jgi:hypothetical protein
MESLARLIVLLFACHFLSGLCSSGIALLICYDMNLWAKNIILLLIPIFGGFVFTFPLSIGYIIGSLIPSCFYWFYLFNQMV